MIHVLVASLMSATLATVATEPSVAKFGKPLQGLETVTVEKVLQSPEDGKAVRLEGTIDRVCQKMGCWLELKQGAAAILVNTEGHSYFVPKDSAGRKAVVEGKVKVAEPDPERVKHFQAEGASQVAAGRVSIVASGIEILPAEAKEKPGEAKKEPDKQEAK